MNTEFIAPNIIQRYIKTCKEAGLKYLGTQDYPDESYILVGDTSTNQYTHVKPHEMKIHNLKHIKNLMQQHVYRIQNNAR